MSLQESIEAFRLSRKMKREKPHFWRMPSANIAYIQNYKVGTRSLRSAVVRYLLEQQGQQLTYDEISKEMIEEMDKKYSGFYSLETFLKKWPDAYLFSFVRNPMVRLYSCYLNKIVDAKRNGIESNFKAFGITFDTTFDEFVRIVVDLPDNASDRHFRSQSWFVSVDGKIIVDYLGKLETFDADWKFIMDKFGFPELPHKNKSSKKSEDVRSFYTKENYQLALERYRSDIELLGYANDV